MTGKRDSFSKLDVSVTLTGEEWFAVLCHIGGRNLSLKGAKIFAAATGNVDQTFYRDPPLPEMTKEQTEAVVHTMLISISLYRAANQ